MSQETGAAKVDLPLVFLVALSWFALTAATPLLRTGLGLGRLHPTLPAFVRMTLMGLVTWAYVALHERRGFSDGFGYTRRRIGNALLVGVLAAVAATALISAYESWVVAPLARRTLEASSAAAPSGGESVPPFGSRLVEYLYVVYEGFVEVLIFVGFLLDRLARRWKAVPALLVANVVFALWHYSYWRKGALEGSLMIGLTFIAGTLVSLGYLRSRNGWTPTVAHWLIDAPGAIRELAGIP